VADQRFITLAFYKGRGRFWDWVVRLATLSKYSHVELVFPSGQWVSSSARDGGVRAKRIHAKPGHWDYIALPPSPALVAAYGQVPFGAKYDWLGAFCTVLCPFRAEKRKRWFCSELAAHLVGAPKPWRMTPARLHRWAKTQF